MLKSPQRLIMHVLKSLEVKKLIEPILGYLENSSLPPLFMLQKTYSCNTRAMVYAINLS